MRCRFAAAFLALAALPSAPSEAADSPLTTARTGIEQWVQTRQVISRTRADWESEKETLLQSKALYQRELAGVEEQFTRVSTNSTQVDRERTAAEADLKEANAALEHARDLAAGLEAKVRGLLPLLPAPLIETMQPLLNRLPSDPQATRTGATERVQTLVSVLNEIDKFNNAVTLFSEKRKNAQGEEVAVETVYAGLGAAYFVNQTGEFAGLGKPGPKGWEWTIQPAVAEKVRDVIRIYRGERTAHFVLLPVTVQ